MKLTSFIKLLSFIAFNERKFGQPVNLCFLISLHRNTIHNQISCVTVDY